jgi:hypothetical protein
MKLRTVPLVAVMSITGLGLIGIGAHATFTTSTSSGQTITAGTYDPTLVGSCASGTNCPVTAGNILYTLSPDDTVLTFTPDTPISASFTTGDEEVTATNTGNLPVSDPTWVIGANVGLDLESEAYVCATSTGIGTDNANIVLYNGPLSGFTGMSYSLSNDVLSPSGTTPTATSGSTDNFVVDVYAGSEPTLCGTNIAAGTTAMGGTSNAPALSGAVVGKNENIAVTVELTYQD